MTSLTALLPKPHTSLLFNWSLGPLADITSQPSCTNMSGVLVPLVVGGFSITTPSPNSPLSNVSTFTTNIQQHWLASSDARHYEQDARCGAQKA